MSALALRAHQLGSGNVLRLAPQRGCRAARSAVAALPVCLSPDQMAAALQRQLAESAEAAAADAQRRAARAAAHAGEPGSAIPPRKPSRRLLRAEARAAAAAAAAAAAQSEELQAAISLRAGMLDGVALASALAVQLRQCGTFDEGEFTEAWGDVSLAARAAADPPHGNGAATPPATPVMPAPAPNMAPAPAPSA